MDADSLVDEYQRTRYLREVSDDLLDKRFDDLAANLWSTNPDGAIVPVGQANWDQLIRRIADVRIEQSIRSGAASFDLNGKDIAFEAAVAYQRPRPKSAFLGSRDCFAKFSKRVHLLRTLNQGILRIAPASSYDDPSLNSAQIDKELEHIAATANEQIVFNLHGTDETGKEVEIPTRAKELFRYMMVPDFYVWCCGLDYYPRLFQDFEADAVLIVRDKAAFKERLSAAVNRRISGASLSEGRVRYYDPYTVRREDLVPIFSKHFRYLYQNEYRFAWTVSHNQGLQPSLVELGSLRDIAELIELE
jgi:hypothetical protein